MLILRCGNYWKHYILPFIPNIFTTIIPWIYTYICGCGMIMSYESASTCMGCSKYKSTTWSICQFLSFSALTIYNSGSAEQFQFLCIVVCELFVCIYMLHAQHREVKLDSHCLSFLMPFFFLGILYLILDQHSTIVIGWIQNKISIKLLLNWVPNFSRVTK